MVHMKSPGKLSVAFAAGGAGGPTVLGPDGRPVPVVIGPDGKPIVTDVDPTVRLAAG